MNCEEWREELKSWLDSQWEVKDEKREVSEHLKEHAAECSHCAAGLQAALLLVNGKRLRKAPPEGLSQRIVERLAQEGRPRVISLQRWVAVPVAAALIVAITFFVTHRFFQPSPSEIVVVRLVLEAPGASNVSVVGDWNGWDPAANRLTDKDGNGTWEIELRLKRGEEHQYQFLIDREKWVPDPKAPLQVEDGFGGLNSILQI